MDNAYLKNPDNKWDTEWFLLEGGIWESFCYDTFESFNEKLWQLLDAMMSRRKKDDKEKIRLTETLDKLVLMVKGCHYFLHHKKRLKFKERWIDIKWHKNPYRCAKKHRPRDDQRLNHHLAHFNEPFTRLTREEAQNFVLAFENFFAEMDLSSWLNLLDDWKSCLESEESLFEWGVDYAPLKTYEKLLTLHEACIVGYHWAEYSYPPPNRHLIEDYLGTFYDGYRNASPFETIDAIFQVLSYEDLRKGIMELYNTCSHERKGISIKMDDLRFCLRWLLHTGWLLLQTDYFPEDWLDPDSFPFMRCPIPEKERKYWEPKSLGVKEQKKLRKTLSKLYYNIDIREETYAIEGKIINYLEIKDMSCSSEYNLAPRDRLLKILDIFALIILDFYERRTRNEGILYPEIAIEEKIEAAPLSI